MPIAPSGVLLLTGIGCGTRGSRLDVCRRGRGWAHRSGMRVQIVQTCPGYHCRGLGCEQRVLPCLVESEGRGATPNIRWEQAQRYIGEAPVDGRIARVCECR
jgi:hypothetical protein